MNQSSEPTRTARQLARPIRWRSGVGTLLLGVVALGLLQNSIYSLTSRPSADFFYILWGLQATLFAWLMLYSRLEPVRRVQVLSIFLCLEMVAYLTLRLDGYAGDGRAILTWRWTPAPGAQFQQTTQSRTTTTSPRSRAQIDLGALRPTDFPGFRGRNRTGTIEGVHLNNDWAGTPPKLLWRQPVGMGWSSFAVAGNYAFTQEQRGEFETVACYELQTGQECWVHRDLARFFEVTGGGGPRATPSLLEGRVYSLGATGILNCLDVSTGDAIWSVNVLEQNGVENRLFGMAGSPLLVDEMVIVAPGAPGNSLVVYRQDDGKKLWGGGNATSAYSSPQYAELAGTRQVLNFNAEGLYAHDLANGAVLWSIPWVSNPEERNNVCQPVVLAGDRIFISSGYGQGCGLFHITNAEEGWHATGLWRNRNLKAKFTSVVTDGDFVYGLDEGILTCLDLTNGERHWKRGRYGHGQLLLVGGHLLVQTEPGDVVLVRASPETFEELARLNALDNRTWNHPALSGKYLLVRNDREAACYELPLIESAP